MNNTELDFDALIEAMREHYDAEGLHWMEKLLHTHVGGPVTALFTQVEIIQRALDRKPEMVPGEVASLKDNVRLASDNIRKIVKALAAANRPPDEPANGD
ncbi:MAG: hypothetical protein BroJett018_17330 [Chloroflexota bacterium]|nr:hypothetical protein [Chloroflexota bacterium]NOG63829.1 hypothetical protein [Chloroflexota bacterium]GIK63939.1 MAG: hypothetical protein BroJett018_17330 [Chloroflexota bacterium]